jgi:spore maturation protein A
MLNIIWVIMVFAGIITGVLTGRTKDVSDAILASCGSAVELAITMLGAMCLWSGIMKVAERAGIVDMMARLLKGVFKFLFPSIPKGHPASGAIAMSVSADLLGLGNAATPLGILAMKELSALNKHSPVASNAMVMFGVINAACIQLIPATILIIRQQTGSTDPSSIIPCVWVASMVATLTGIISAKLLEKTSKDNGYALRKAS